MPLIHVPDVTYRRVEAFTAVARAVMDEDTDTATSFEIVLELGLKAALNNVICTQEEPILIQTIHQLAERDPELVCGYVADMVGLGADIRRQEGRRRPIGFRPWD
jgi:hypothetical protein